MAFLYLGCGKLVAPWRRLETRRPETSASDPGREVLPPGIDWSQTCRSPSSRRGRILGVGADGRCWLRTIGAAVVKRGYRRRRHARRSCTPLRVQSRPRGRRGGVPRWRALDSLVRLRSDATRPTATRHDRWQHTRLLPSRRPCLSLGGPCIIAEFFPRSRTWGSRRGTRP